MRTAVRRRIAAVVVLPIVATVVGVTFLSTAGNAAIINVAYSNPPFNSGSVTITFTNDASALSPRPIPAGSTVEYRRTGTTNDVFYSQVQSNSSPTQSRPVTTVNLSDPEAIENDPSGAGLAPGKGRVNPAEYDVTFYNSDPRNNPPPPGVPARVLDSCTRCVTVLAPAAPTMTSITPSKVAAGTTGLDGTVKGSDLARGTTVQVLPITGNTAQDVVVAVKTAFASGQQLDVKITVPPAATGGVRDVLVTNTDGQTALCTGCFTVLGQNLTSVSPTRATNNDSDSARTIIFSGPPGTIAADAQPSLAFIGDPGATTRDSLGIPGTVTSRAGDGSSITATYNLVAAAPGDSVYQPSVQSASTGTFNLCGCRFSVDQLGAPSVTAVDPAAQDRGTTQVVTVGGTNFAKGTNVTVVGGGVTTTKVEYVSRTQLKATFAVAGTAASGKRDVTAKLTDGRVSAACVGCYTINGNTPPPSPTGTPTSPSPSPTRGTASPSSCPSNATSASPTTSPTTTASASASGTASPTATASATGTASPTATASPTGTASPTASATASGTATPRASNCPTSSPTATRQTLTLFTSDSNIPAGSTATLQGSGQPNQAYSLQCYSRPSTQYTEARAGSFDAFGSPVTFTVSLGRNTRCFLQYATNSTQGQSPSIVINVRTVLSLSTVRTATLTYVFQGRNLPRVAGQLITLYRVDAAGNEIRTSNLVTDDSGIYRVTRKFTGTGTFRFKVRTSQTLNNAAGVSNTISVTVR